MWEVKRLTHLAFTKRQGVLCEDVRNCPARCATLFSSDSIGGSLTPAKQAFVASCHRKIDWKERPGPAIASLNIVNKPELIDELSADDLVRIRELLDGTDDVARGQGGHVERVEL